MIDETFFALLIKKSEHRINYIQYVYSTLFFHIYYSLYASTQIRENVNALILITFVYEHLSIKPSTVQ